MKTEYSDLTLRLKEVLSGKEIMEGDIPDIEFLKKESELFGEYLVAATKPLLTKLMNDVNRYTGMNSDSTQMLIADPNSFDELAENVAITFDSLDIDGDRRALRLSIATYVKGLQSIFLNFQPRLRIHSLYVDYLKKQNLKLTEKLESKSKAVRRLKPKRDGK